MPLRVNTPYRIAVKFEPPLSTVGQLRDLAKRTNTTRTALVGMSPYEASVIVVYGSAREVAAIAPGALLFKVSGGTFGPISRAVIQTIRPEVNFKP